MPKRKAYTVREKLELITRIRNGESQAKVARETSIADSTLRGWLKCEGALRQYADGLQDEDGLKRKKQRTAKDPVLDTAMVNWFAQERQTGLPISGPIVKAQADAAWLHKTLTFYCNFKLIFYHKHFLTMQLGYRRV